MGDCQMKNKTKTCLFQNIHKLILRDGNHPELNSKLEIIEADYLQGKLPRKLREGHKTIHHFDIFPRHLNSNF